MLACLFQMSSVCLAKTYASPDCPFLPTENVKSKPPFPGKLLWGGLPCPFPPDKQDRGFSGRKMEGDMRGKKKFRAQGLHVDREIFFLSNSEILTGITSQDSKCFLSCYNPLKFFFSIRPVILSVFLTHSPWYPSSTLQASPRGQGKRPRRLSSLWPIIGECWEVFCRAAELISYLNTKDSRAR